MAYDFYLNFFPSRATYSEADFRSCHVNATPQESDPDQGGAGSFYQDISQPNVNALLPGAGHGLPLFFLTTALLSCSTTPITARKSGQSALSGVCSNTPIEITNLDLSTQDLEVINTALTEDWQLLSQKNPELLCGISQINLGYTDTGDFGFSYAIDRQGKALLTIAFGRTFMEECSSNQDYCDYGLTQLMCYQDRSWMRYAFFQAFGYHVMATLAVNDPETFENFAEYSWKKDVGCSKVNYLDELENCWSLLEEPDEHDFIHEDSAEIPENVLEDWVDSFALVALYDTSGESYDWPSAEFIGQTIERTGWYTDKGLEKWYWMDSFLEEYSSAD